MFENVRKNDTPAKLVTHKLKQKKLWKKFEKVLITNVIQLIISFFHN